MIKIVYQTVDNIISKVNIFGHAKYDDYGKDIVCASVSSIAISTINGILSIDNESIKYVEDKELTITNNKKDVITNRLLQNMINMFIELESTYPQNIKIRKEDLK